MFRDVFCPTFQLVYVNFIMQPNSRSKGANIIKFLTYWVMGLCSMYAPPVHKPICDLQQSPRAKRPEYCEQRRSRLWERTTSVTPLSPMLSLWGVLVWFGSIRVVWDYVTSKDWDQLIQHTGAVYDASAEWHWINSNIFTVSP